MGVTRSYVGLDIGTTKISVVIAEPDDLGNLKVVGVGMAPSHGLRRGVVVNLDETVTSIRRAVAEAERMAGVSVKVVWAGIAGEHIRSLNSRGVITVSRRDAEIGPADVDRVIEVARTMDIPEDREVFHVIPQEFTVDSQGGIKDPVGMSGVRLEADVHVVTGGMTPARNLSRAIERAGLKLAALVLEPLASAHAVLAREEKDLGVALLDLGGGTTDLALFYEGSVRHTGVVGLGGVNITNDLAVGLRTGVEQAEEIKIRHGCALAALVPVHEMIEVPGVAGRPTREISRHLMATMIEPRVQEILTMARREMHRTHFGDRMTAGVVLTGGASLMPGLVELAEEVLDLPVRRGAPEPLIPGEAGDPRQATGLGLVRYAWLRDHDEYGMNGNGDGIFRGLAGVRRWFSEFF
ncbi:MAG: cell division protein FtsA [Candidatus Eisenbacteria bacterium]|nr:cell division protein FtsA [Candidatus Eisenbacteria bacterium]